MVRFLQPMTIFLEECEKRIHVMVSMWGLTTVGTCPMTVLPLYMETWALSPATASTLLLVLQSTAYTGVPSLILRSREPS
jgi:hypothetical protein